LTNFKFHIIFQISGKTLKRQVPFDRWEISIEKLGKLGINKEEATGSISKKIAVFLRSVLTLSHSTNCYQFINSLKSGYQIDYEISRDLLVDFANTTPTFSSKLDTILLGNLKISISEICLSKFSDSDLQSVKLVANTIETETEQMLGLRLSVTTHLQALKPTVAPFKDNLLKKSVRIVENGEKTSAEQEKMSRSEKINLDLDYFDMKKEDEDIGKLVEDNKGPELNPEDFYKKIKEIKKKIQMEEQYIPSLENMERTFYELLETEGEILKELSAKTKEELKL